MRLRVGGLCWARALWDTAAQVSVTTDLVIAKATSGRRTIRASKRRNRILKTGEIQPSRE